MEKYVPESSYFAASRPVSVFLTKRYDVPDNCEMYAPLGVNGVAIFFLHKFPLRSQIDCQSQARRGIERHSTRFVAFARANRRNCTMAELRFPSWLRLRLAQEGMLICFSPLLKGKVRDASASAQREHKGGEWVFSELKNEPVLSHFYCITSCLVAHCLFGRFFFAFFPLY